MSGRLIVDQDKLRNVLEAAVAVHDAALTASVLDLLEDSAPAPRRGGWLTVDEAAEALSVHRATVHRRLADGTLRGRKVGGRRLVVAADCMPSQNGARPGG